MSKIDFAEDFKKRTKKFVIGQSLMKESNELLAIVSISRKTMKAGQTS